MSSTRDYSQVPSSTIRNDDERVNYNDDDDDDDDDDFDDDIVIVEPSELSLSDIRPRHRHYPHPHVDEAKGLMAAIANDGNNNATSSSPGGALSVPSQRITVDEAIERVGMGYFQLRILTAAGICFASDAMQVLLLSFLCQVLRVEWNLTNDETAFITSILFIGALFGTLVLGPLADKKGRKPIFLLAACIISTFGFSVGAFAMNYWNVLLLLFMVGFGVGGLTVPFDILAEFLPAISRGKNLLVIEYFWTIGVLFVVLIAYMTLGGNNNNNNYNDGDQQQSDSSGNWRLFVMLVSTPSFFAIVFSYFVVPESPRWLCTQGRCGEALEIIRAAAKYNGIHSDLVFPEGITLLPEPEEESADFCLLFTPRWKWTTLKLWGAWGAFAFGYYGTIMVITEIFDNNNDNNNNQHEGKSSSYNFDYGAIFVSSSAEFVGTTFAILSVDKAGRIPLQVVSYAMAGLCVFSLCVLASHQAHRNVLISLGFAARIFEMSGSCVSWVSTAEILATEVRTTGHSAANAVARIGSLFAPFLIEGSSSLARKGFVMLVLHSFTIVCVSQLPETKGSHMGREHGEDIEDLALTIESNDCENENEEVDQMRDDVRLIT